MRSRRRRRGSLEDAVLTILEASDQALTPADVQAALDDDLAYTTVMTVLGRLHRKSVVTREPQGRGYAYRAIRNPAERAARRMQMLMDQEEDRATVLTQFVDGLSTDDEATLRAVLAADDQAPQ